MALVKWQPRRNDPDPFQSLRQVVDRLFEDACRGVPRRWTPTWVTASGAGFIPNVDVKETAHEYVVTVEVPGLRPEDLDVHITADTITIKGERKEEQENKRESYYYRESSVGSFQRVIPLPGPVVAEKAAAQLKDGVLTLTLPKAEPSKLTGVKVKVE